MEQKREEKKEERRGGFGDRRQQNRRPPEKKEREEEQWIPITKLGRLVKGGFIKSVEEIYKFALPIKGIAIIAKKHRGTNC